MIKYNQHRKEIMENRQIGTRKRYDNEFKIEIVKLIEKENYGLREASLRLGISKSTLSKWKQLFGHDSCGQNTSGGVSDCGMSIFEQKQLQKELEKTRRERDILKKALAYFAAEH
jgi:transposase